MRISNESELKMQLIKRKPMVIIYFLKFNVSYSFSNKLKIEIVRVAH